MSCRATLLPTSGIRQASCGCVPPLTAMGFARNSGLAAHDCPNPPVFLRHGRERAAASPRRGILRLCTDLLPGRPLATPVSSPHLDNRSACAVFAGPTLAPSNLLLKRLRLILHPLAWDVTTPSLVSPCISSHLLLPHGARDCLILAARLGAPSVPGLGTSR